MAANILVLHRIMNLICKLFVQIPAQDVTYSLLMPNSSHVSICHISKLYTYSTLITISVI